MSKQQKKEESLQISICKYIRLQYPKVLFNVDLSGIKLTIGQATKLKKQRSGKSFPDISIYETNNKYSGLFIESKRETPYLKDGKTLKRQMVAVYKTIGGEKIKVDEYNHLEKQAIMHQRLRERGYKAEFVWNIDMAIDIIDRYFLEG